MGMVFRMVFGCHVMFLQLPLFGGLRTSVGRYPSSLLIRSLVVPVQADLGSGMLLPN